MTSVREQEELQRRSIEQLQEQLPDFDLRESIVKEAKREQEERQLVVSMQR